VIAAPFMSAYVASKHAVTGFTRSLQLEHEQSQNPIRIILVSPGFVKTDILNSNKEFKLPDWMSMVTEPTEKVAQEIVRGIERGESEIVATLHGKVINQILRVLPRTLPRATKLLVAKNWKQLLGLEPIKKE
jgi:short-subunit dehydrogenase